MGKRVVDNSTDVLIYLDHNVLDKMTKEQLDKIFDHLSQKMIPVYSDESLQEIWKSRGYENKFLSLLKEMGAVHLRLEAMNFRYTGKAAFIDIDPFEAYSLFIENKDDMPEYGYGFSGLLRKFYGGIEDKSFAEVLRLGMNELLVEMDKSFVDLQRADDLSEKDRVMAEGAIAQLKNTLPHVFSEMGQTLDNQMKSTTPIRQVEEYLLTGPKRLNNIKAPDVVKNIWARMSKRIPDKALTLEAFFGLTPDIYRYADKRELSLVEKVNALYHQLNFIGYHRDSKMQDRQKFNASFSDRTHAGCAIFCHYFMSMDKRTIMKTAAAYEYLGVFTKPLHLRGGRMG